MWYDYCYSSLNYRTLKFEKFYAQGDYQGNAVINYCQKSIPWTRISEHKHFSPWEEHSQSCLYKEYSSSCRAGIDIPYYPTRLQNDKEILCKYREHAEKKFRKN